MNTYPEPAKTSTITLLLTIIPSALGVVEESCSSRLVRLKGGHVEEEECGDAEAFVPLSDRNEESRCRIEPDTEKGGDGKDRHK